MGTQRFSNAKTKPSRVLRALALWVACIHPLQAGDEIRYGRDIRPILSDNCFFCHGTDPKTREEDLRLDIRESALESEAFVPGKPEKSLLIQRINTTDGDDIMPPPKSHKKLDAREKQLLSDWIKAGAKYEDHWAYSKPRREPGESIDSLVARDLAAKNLKLSPPADPATLLRRMHIDVTGLPPGPDEVAAFLDAYSSNPAEAVRNAVDQLLASPHFGERMALSWLDSVRYADTVGYHGDQERSASPYRDYVINAFNSDKPFDQFTIEQLAGDLLPNPTLEQQIAASYNRLNPLSEEGGIQDAEYLAKYQAERVRTTSSTWLGSTMACCECHDHKFDPFTAKDFYSFAAYFSDILEKGAWNNDGHYQEDISKWTQQGVTFDKWGPVVRVPSGDQKARLESIATLINALRSRIEQIPAATDQELDEWLAEQRALLASTAPYDAPILAVANQENVTIDRPDFIDSKQGPVRSGSQSRRQASADLIQHIAVLKNPIPIQEGDEFYLWVYLDPEQATKSMMLQVNLNGDWGHRAYWGEAAIPYGKPEGGAAYHRAGDLPKAGEWTRLSVPASAIGLPPGASIGQLACTQFGGRIYWDDVGLHTRNPAHRLGQFPAELVQLLRDPAADRVSLTKYFNHLKPAYQELTHEIAALNSERENLLAMAPTVPATISATPRPIRLLKRGNWQDTSGPIVSPAPPAFLTPPSSTPAATELPRGTRLDLARWITRTDNPLTARVFVNRLWAQIFGIGLSKNTGDLGFQGEYPSHPELLDWLAIEFVENQWSVKHLLRTILLSETYQQSSSPHGDLQQLDPKNRLLARQSQFRLPAELIRDNALAVSGLLTPTVGGPSAKPYQPAGYYRNLNFPAREYVPDSGAALYRRGLYTHWQRTFLHPMLKAFDAPSREECATERTTSNTPLQALDLLNDPTFTEAARALATLLLSETAGETDLVSRAFIRCLARPPSAEEAAILAAYHQQELERFTASPEAAAQFLSIGASPVPKEITAVRLAAATSLARAILNLHETITRY